MHVAALAASLDALAPGRVLLGIGAGHTFREWHDIGQDRPSAADRAGRLAEFVDAVARLLDGELVTLDGRYLTLHGSRLERRPAGAGRVSLAVGGGHPQVLRAAARRADVVGLSGLGRTLPDGHTHLARWSQADLQGQLQLVGDEARLAGRAPVLEALVQTVLVTSDRDASIVQMSRRFPAATAQDIARTPYVLIGSYQQMAAQLRAQAEGLGITSYVVRQPAVPHMERVLALLAA
jgi:alkanesulfonate monooxygenase SsuD/methylene tetrahydromethanopterin reductase-like flavin-dependent oxidoreductase (luciferase family)